MIRPPPISTLFPYTTLFRSIYRAESAVTILQCSTGNKMNDGPPRPVYDCEVTVPRAVSTFAFQAACSRMERAGTPRHRSQNLRGEGERVGANKSKPSEFAPSLG